MWFRQRGFTLIEMVIAFSLALLIMGAFQFMYGTYQTRLVKVIQKSQGNQAVRLLLTKMRQELKAATGIQIKDSPGGEQNAAIKIFLGAKEYHGVNNFAVEYYYDKAKKGIHFTEYSDSLPKDGGTAPGEKVIRQGYLLGGATQTLGFFCGQTDINTQIITQKHRVEISIDYYDTVSNKRQANQELVAPKTANLTVFPRYTNTFLKIDVPQDQP